MEVSGSRVSLRIPDLEERLALDSGMISGAFSARSGTLFRSLQSLA